MATTTQAPEQPPQPPNNPPQAQRARVIGLSAMAFLLMVTYAIARPASESLFLGTYGSQRLPWVWMAIAVIVVLVVNAYNKVVSQVGLLRLYILVMLISSAILAILLAAMASDIPGATFLLYIWKDVYIVVLVELFWSFANSVFPIKTARWAYGLFGVMGSLGGIVGNLAVGQLARPMGTANTLWLIMPLFLIIGVICVAFSRKVGDVLPETNKDKHTDLASGFRVIRQSAYLAYLVILIAVVQIAITLIDYQYNQILEITFTTTHERTAIIGQVYAAIDLAAIALQLMTGLILTWVGVPLTLLSIPLLLALALGGFVLWPGFLALAIAKIISKSTNYSIFKAAKEILYIPLQYDEKTQGKAVVDILAYRFAKGAASLLLLALLFFQLQGPALLPVFTEPITSVLHILVGLNNSIFVSLIALVLLIVWFWLTLAIVRRYRKKVSRKEELQN